MGQLVPRPPRARAIRRGATGGEEGAAIEVTVAASDSIGMDAGIADIEVAGDVEAQVAVAGVGAAVELPVARA
jgi:hypothetical protein